MSESVLSSVLTMDGDVDSRDVPQLSDRHIQETSFQTNYPDLFDQTFKETLNLCNTEFIFATYNYKIEMKKVGFFYRKGGKEWWHGIRGPGIAGFTVYY